MEAVESDGQIIQTQAQRDAWAMLQRARAVLDLGAADLVVVRARHAAAHIALLARLFPSVGFELAERASTGGHSVRVLWAADGFASLKAGQAAGFDAAVVAHPARSVPATLALFPAHARVAAWRDVRPGRALSVFGKGLARDLFRPAVRAHAAA